MPTGCTCQNVSYISSGFHFHLIQCEILSSSVSMFPQFEEPDWSRGYMYFWFFGLLSLLLARLSLKDCHTVWLWCKFFTFLSTMCNIRLSLLALYVEFFYFSFTSPCESAYHGRSGNRPSWNSNVSQHRTHTESIWNLHCYEKVGYYNVQCCNWFILSNKAALVPHVFVFLLMDLSIRLSLLSPVYKHDQ